MVFTIIIIIAINIHQIASGLFHRGNSLAHGVAVLCRGLACFVESESLFHLHVEDFTKLGRWSI